MMLIQMVLIASTCAHAISVVGTIKVRGVSSSVLITSTGIGMVGVAGSANATAQCFDPSTLALGRVLSLAPPKQSFPPDAIIEGPSFAEAQGLVVACVFGETGEDSKHASPRLNVKNLLVFQTFRADTLESVAFADLSNLITPPPSWNGYASIVYTQGGTIYVAGMVMHYKDPITFEIEVLQYLVAINITTLKPTVLRVWGREDVQFGGPALQYERNLFLPIEAGFVTFDLDHHNFTIISTKQGPNGYIATPVLAISSETLFVAQQGYTSTYFAALSAGSPAPGHYTRFLNGVCDIANSAFVINSTWVLFGCTAWGVGARGGQLAVMDFSSEPVVLQELVTTDLTLDSQNVAQFKGHLFFSATGEMGGVTKVRL